MRARDVTDLYFMNAGLIVLRKCISQNHSLPFAIGANQFEDRCVQPESFAFPAFAHRRIANRHRRHIDVTSRTLQYRQLRRLRSGRRSAAMRAVLVADEEHAKTGCARNGSEF